MKQPAVEAPLDVGVRPVAYLHTEPSGTQFVVTLDDYEGECAGCQPLYDQAALDAAVDAVHARHRAMLADCKSGLVQALNACNPKAPESLQQRCFEQVAELLGRLDSVLAERPNVALNR